MEGSSRRVLQGIGASGLPALIQGTTATIIPPRQLGRYSGYSGAVLAVGTGAVAVLPPASGKSEE